MFRVFAASVCRFCRNLCCCFPCSADCCHQTALVHDDSIFITACPSDTFVCRIFVCHLRMQLNGLSCTYIMAACNRDISDKCCHIDSCLCGLIAAVCRGRGDNCPAEGFGCDCPLLIDSRNLFIAGFPLDYMACLLRQNPCCQCIRLHSCIEINSYNFVCDNHVIFQIRIAVRYHQVKCFYWICDLD